MTQLLAARSRFTVCRPCAARGRSACAAASVCERSGRIWTDQRARPLPGTCCKSCCVFYTHECPFFKMGRIWSLTKPTGSRAPRQTSGLQRPHAPVEGPSCTQPAASRAPAQECSSPRCQQNPPTGLGGWKHQGLRAEAGSLTWAAGQVEVGGQVARLGGPRGSANPVSCGRTCWGPGGQMPSTMCTPGGGGWPDSA